MAVANIAQFGGRFREQPIWTGNGTMRRFKLQIVTGRTRVSTSLEALLATTTTEASGGCVDGACLPSDLQRNLDCTGRAH